MIPPPSTMVDWPKGLRRYLAASTAFHLAWEVLQLPLSTIWSEPWHTQAFALLQCTIGDLMIAGLSLLVALALIGEAHWPQSGLRLAWLILLGLGVGYTLYSEWLNVSVRQSWSYGPLMPTLPVISTGLAPLAQWFVIPTLVLRAAAGRWPWRQPGASRQ